MKIILMKMKKFYESLSKKMRIIIFGGLAIAVALAIIIPMALDANYKSSNPYVVLYSDVNEAESLEIYTALQTLGIDVQMNNRSQTMVREDQVARAKAEMAMQGLPKTALSYDIFDSKSGFMTTELERKQALVYQLQNRLQDTLSYIDAIRSAVVTIAIPDEISSSYVWASATSEVSASVMLNLKSNVTLTPQQVRGIKYLVSSGVPLLEIENVRVVDALTAVELSDTEITSTIDTNLLQLQFQSEVEKKMVEKVKTLLAPTYGADNIAVAATVVLDFDSMISEEMTYYPELDGHGVLEYLEKHYDATDGSVAAGIVGETDNTDIPIYPTEEDIENGVVSSDIVAKYLVSYLHTQIEKNQAKTLSSSVSVIIKGQEENAISEETIEALNNNVAKALNLNTTDVLVSYFQDINVVPIVTPTDGNSFNTNTLIFFGAVAVTILLLIIIILMAVRRAKKRKIEKALEAEREAQMAEEAERRRIEEEKAKSISMLQDENNKVKDTIDGIKDFAMQNPQIAASLIKEWLRDGD